MWYAVVGLVLGDVGMVGLIWYLYSHIKERDEWVRAWVAEFYQKHNSLYDLVKGLKERVYEVERIWAVTDLRGDRLTTGGVRGQYSRTVAIGDTATDTESDSADGDANTFTLIDDAAVYFPDIATGITYPHTLRECCADNRPDDCPSWRVIGSLCIDLWTADTVR